jgi:tape measure domain-containing protein
MSGTNNRWTLRLSTEGADQVVRDLRAAATESAAAARAYDTLIKAQPQLATGAEQAEQALRKNTDAMRGMRGELTALNVAQQAAASSMGSFGAALASPTAAIAALTVAASAGTVQIARIGDEYTNTMNKLRSATGSLGAAQAVYGQLVALSQQTGASISESAGAFVRFSVAARAIGATNGEVLQLTRTIQQAGLISGASTQEAAAGVQQLGQALASGKLQGDELRSILENMPTLAEALAGQLGVSIGRLREMGTAGELTSDRVFQALLRASVDINKQFSDLTPTMGRAFSILGQSMVEFVGKLDQALGLSQAIARAAAAAAAAVGNVSRGITARTPAEQAEFDVGEATARRARLEAELASLSGEPGIYAAPRRGTISRGMQEAAAQTQPREARLAELRERIEAENGIIQQGLERRNQAHIEADEVRQAEEATAAARRGAATAGETRAAGLALQERNKTEADLRAAHATRIADIERNRLAGNFDQAEADRLRAAETRKLADEIKALNEANGTRADVEERLAAASQAVIDIEKDRTALMREGETLTASVRTEAEKYAETLANLNNLLGAGAITQDTYNRAVAAADPAVKVAAEASRRIEQENTRTTDRITGFFGDAFARAFEGTGDGFKGLMASFQRAAISTFASIAAQSIIRPIIAPIVSGLGLGQVTGSGGVGGMFGGTAQAATPGGQAGGVGASDLGSFSTLRTAYNGFTSPGGLGGFFPGGAAVNSGFSGLDGVLNTSLVTPTLNSLTPTLGAGSFLPAGVSGPVLQATAPVATSGLSVAGSLGPLAAIGGGAYGVYSGLQRGGVGGYTSAAGGAISAATGIGMLGSAAGLLPALGALGPIGLGIGAVLAIAGSLMPGAKPSGMGQLARTNLNTGMETTEGLTGKRYSAGNAAAAGSTVDNIVSLAKEIGGKLGGASIGGDVAVGVTRGDIYLDVNGQKARAANTEQGAKDIAAAAAQMVLNEFRGQGTVQGDYRGIVAASGTIEQLSANLDFYEKTYKVLIGTAEKTTEFAESLRALVKPFDDAIDRSASLSLATDILATKRAEELEKALGPMLGAAKVSNEYVDGLKAIRENYEATIRVVAELGRGTDDLREAMGKAEAQFKKNANAAFQGRLDEVSGNGFLNEIRGVLAEYDAKATSAASMGRDYSEITHLAVKNILDGLTAAQLRLVAGSDFQANTGTNELARAMLPAVEAAERAAVAQEAAAKAQQEAAQRLQAVLQAGGGVRAYLDGQRGTSAPGGATPQQALAEAQAQFGRDLALSRGGDLDALGRITGTADRVLTAGQDMFASSPEFQALRSMVLSSLEALPATRSYDQLTLDTLQSIASGQMRATELLGVLSADVDRDQRITWPEFAGFATSQADAFSALATALGATGASTTALFQQIDADNDGILSRLEIQNSLAASAVQLGEGTLGNVLRLGTAYDLGNQLQSGGNELLVTLTGILDTLRYSAEAHLPFLTRLPDMQTSLFLLKELARGQAGGLRITTLQSSGGADGGFQASGSYVGNPFGISNFGGLVDGGWVGNGIWNKDSVLASFAGGGAIALAGGEHVTNAPMAARYAGELNAINAGTFGSSDAVARMMERLAREIAELRAEMQRMVRAGERTADATEDTAASNAKMVRSDAIVGRRAA